MTDVVDRATRSRMMAGIRGKDTKPELAVRRFLHRQGFRYRISPSGVPGRPDIVLPRWRTVVFVHGCFWHRHRGCRLSYVPKTREAFWTAKFEQNVERDRRTSSYLRRQGWSVRVVWGCQINDRRLLRLCEEIRNPPRLT